MQPPTSWRVFRGPDAGVVKANIPTEWDGATSKNILWKSPVPLEGQNSPIVVNDRIFLAGATKEKQEIFCFDAKTGALLWSAPVGEPKSATAPSIMDDTGYAAPTMTTDGTRVFAIFPTGDLAALDLAGKIIWTKSFGKLDNQYGHASSLLMHENRLIVQLDQGLEPSSGKSAIIAFDTATGNEVWKTPRPVANSWTSPILVTTPTGPQIITAANPFAIGHSPVDGKELWRVKTLAGDVAPSPAFGNGLVFVAMENAVAAAIKLDGSGDVSKTHVAWEIDDPLPDIVSPVATDKFLFLVQTFGTVTCHNMTDGKKIWEHEFDGPFHSSPLVINDVVHLTDRKGVTHRFEAATEFKLINACALGEPVSTTPAIVGDRMYIRAKNNLYCIGVK